MSNKKTTKRGMNSLTQVELRNQKLKNGSPVTGRVTTLQEKNREVLNKLASKIAK